MSFVARAFLSAGTRTLRGVRMGDTLSPEVSRQEVFEQLLSTKVESVQDRQELLPHINTWNKAFQNYSHCGKHGKLSKKQRELFRNKRTLRGLQLNAKYFLDIAGSGVMWHLNTGPSISGMVKLRPEVGGRHLWPSKLPFSYKSPFCKGPLFHSFFF